MLNTKNESTAFTNEEEHVKLLQDQLINEHFTPRECCESLESWDVIFETALFRVEDSAITPDYIRHLWSLYDVRRKVHLISEYVDFDEIDD